MCLYLFVFFFCCRFFSVTFCFCIVFCFLPPFFFIPQFKIDLVYPQTPDKGYICSLIFFVFICIFYWSAITQPVFTCSKVTIETEEKGVKYVQKSKLKHHNVVNGVVLAYLLLTLNIFNTFFWCFYC